MDRRRSRDRDDFNGCSANCSARARPPGRGFRESSKKFGAFFALLQSHQMDEKEPKHENGENEEAEDGEREDEEREEQKAIGKIRAPGHASKTAASLITEKGKRIGS